MKPTVFHNLAARALSAALIAAPLPAVAALAVGAAAPDFTVQATQSGKVFTFSLDAALKKGPVVLYFYPAAFTKGCTIEAHDFASAMPDYRKYGATVLGISADQLDK
ncbi:MAG: redoxin domain-containing protein, partial [Rhizobiaceae bacterium]